MRIPSMPRVPCVLWCLSTATGIIFAILGFTSHLTSFHPVRIGSVIPAEEQMKLPPQPEQTLLAAAAMAATPQGKTAISGRVVKDNVPVPGANVYIYEQDTGTKWETVAKSDGSFRVEIPKQDDSKWMKLALTAVAQHPQHSFGWTMLFKDSLANVVIELHRPMVIRGTIVDELGDPVQGAEVQMGAFSFPVAGDPYGGTLIGEAIPNPLAKTDSKGKFTFHSLPEGSEANLYVAEPGYAREMRIGIPTGTAEVGFKLRREARIQGRVTFAGTGSPAKGVEVCAVGAYPRSGLQLTIGHAETYTDENGYYTLSNNLPAGEYAVFPKEDYPDWTAVAKEYVKVAEGQIVKNVDLKLVKGGIITGRVTDRNTDEPIQDHQVSLRDASHPGYQGSYTDKNGVYRFRAAPGKAMIYTTRPTPEGYEDTNQVTKYVDVVEDETVSDVDFQFWKIISLTCRVLTPDGQPVAGAAITDRMEPLRTLAISDEDGKSIIFVEHRPGRKFPAKAKQAELQLRGYAALETQTDAEIEILMERYETTNASGRVVNERGESVPYADISLVKWEEGLVYGNISVVGTTDISGEYEMTGLIIGDEYLVRAGAKGYRKGKTEKFTAAADMPSLKDIVLMLPSFHSFFLEGTVSDTDGNPVAGAWVTAMSVQDEVVRTEENGHYRLDDLHLTVEPELGIDHPDYGFSRFRYVATNQTQDFQLVKAGGYLAGKVVDTDGNPVEEAYVSIYFDDEALASGHVNVGTETDPQGGFWLDNLLVDERPSIYVRRRRLHQIFADVEINRDDLVFVLQESSEPPEPVTAKETARSEYAKSARVRLRRTVGKPAPELDVAQWLHGKPVTLADLRGRVVVLHFWASRFVRTVEAIRFLNTLQKEYDEKRLVCIGIHESTAHLDELKQLIKENRAAYHISVDKEPSVAGAKGVTFHKYAIARFPGAYATTLFPSFIVIDGEGINHGHIRDHELEEKIRELVSD